MSGLRHLAGTVLLATSAAFLAACAGPNVKDAASVEQLLDDRMFAPHPPIPDAAQIVALSVPMRQYLERVIRPQTLRSGSVQGLVNALYNSDQLRISYDSTATLTAAETFSTRRGDCLSLVLMTAAFARELGLDVRFQRVLIPEVALPDGDLVRMVGHVNISLADRGSGARSEGRMTIDFLLPEDARRLQFEPVTLDRVEAMYLNNKAAESLVQGQLGPAYWWARASVLRDPTYSSALITLGAILDRADRLDLARAAYERALTLDPGNTNVLSNLQLTEERRAEKSALSTRAAARQQVLGLLKGGKFAQARQHLLDRLERDDDPSFHLLLAAAYLGLDQPALAISELEVASRAPLYGATKQAALRAKIAALQAQSDAR